MSFSAAKVFWFDILLSFYFFPPTHYKEIVGKFSM